MSAGKIIAIFISEVLEALMAVVCLLVMGSFPDFPGKESLIGAVISLWALGGITTPFLIWFEIWDMLPRGGFR